MSVTVELHLNLVTAAPNSINLFRRPQPQTKSSPFQLTNTCTTCEVLYLSQIQCSDIMHAVQTQGGNDIYVTVCICTKKGSDVW